MKVLLFGGSFDPPHLGHAEILRVALRALRPHKTFVVPAYHSPLKDIPRTPARHRLQMTRAMVRALPEAGRDVQVDPFELRRGRTTYTYEILRHFRSRYPGGELWFLVGGDAAAEFSRWKRPEELRRACRWALAERPGFFPPLAGLEAARLPVKPPPWSSTDIRGRLLAGLWTDEMLPEPVRAYIRRRRLYGLDIHRELQKTLSADRYRHTLGVTRLALELATTHSADPERAALAGLVHDCGRRFDAAGMSRYARLHQLSAPHRAQILRCAPLLLHAYISADLARRRFGVSDPQILSAVRNHTLGAVGMPALDRLLFVADIASEDRGFHEAVRIRQLARQDLGRAFVEAARAKVHYVRTTGQWLHPQTSRFLRWAEGLK